MDVFKQTARTPLLKKKTKIGFVTRGPPEFNFARRPIIMLREAIAGLCLVVAYVATRSGTGGPCRVSPRVCVRSGHLPPFLVVRLPQAQSPTFWLPPAQSPTLRSSRGAAGRCFRPASFACDPLARNSRARLCCVLVGGCGERAKEAGQQYEFG